MICISGKASRSFHPIIGVVAKNHRPIFARKNTIFVTEKLDKSSIGYKACISSGRKGHFFHPDHIYNCKDIEILHDGDIRRNGMCLSSLGNKITSKCIYDYRSMQL